MNKVAFASTVNNLGRGIGMVVTRIFPNVNDQILAPRNADLSTCYVHTVHRISNLIICSTYICMYIGVPPTLSMAIYPQTVLRKYGTMADFNVHFRSDCLVKPPIDRTNATHSMRRHRIIDPASIPSISVQTDRHAANGIKSD